MGEVRVGGWYCNAVASENSVTKWQRSWAIDRIRVTMHTGAKTKTILGADGKLYKRKRDLCKMLFLPKRIYWILF